MRASSLTCPQKRPSAAFRLICIPHAGAGAASFHQLATLLPGEIELNAVQLPGRETRLAEAPYRRLAPLVADLTQELRDLTRQPYVLFGHSMGALIAFELARAFRREALSLPRMIIVSGRRAPTVPNTEPPLHVLPDKAFVDALVRRYDAIPKVIRDEPELMALFVPVLKADFATFETHCHQDEPPLACGLAMYGGREDPQTAEMPGWANLFAGSSRTRLFNGGHFYLTEQRQALASALAEDVLAPAIAE